jgi:hypothetical protein
VAGRAPSPKLCVGLLWLGLAGCDLAYPEVVIRNKTCAQLQIANPSFNGCVWSTVLADGSSTLPGRCLPGEDRVHFESFEVASTCGVQAGPEAIDQGGAHDGGGAGPRIDAGKTNRAPTWFNYQTVSVHRVGYGEFHIFEITLDDIEQDFSEPGPYGH